MTVLKDNKNKANTNTFITNKKSIVELLLEKEK